MIRWTVVAGPLTYTGSWESAWRLANLFGGTLQQVTVPEDPPIVLPRWDTLPWSQSTKWQARSYFSHVDVPWLEYAAFITRRNAYRRGSR